MKYNVIAIAGAIEEVSLSANILRATQKLGLDTLDIEICSIKELPLLNVDLFTDSFPAEIGCLREKVAKSDGLLFACP